MFKKLILIVIILCMLIVVCTDFYITKNNSLPVIAIANYGPHSSLNLVITGFKKQMESEGFIENQNVRYEIADVGFDQSIISQMIMSLKNKNPKLMLAMTTPVAQAAKCKIHNIPLIYAVITDPVEAGLIKEKYKSDTNITGSSDMQDLTAFLKFVRSVLPEASRVGLLYATSEDNDIALVNMMKDSASLFDMSVVAIPIEQARDVQIRVQEFKDKVDFIYVGASGPIQPTLPVISVEAHKMHIPIFNVESQAVKDGLTLASFGVDYSVVGKNAAKLSSAVLHGEKISDLIPLYPILNDYHVIINKKVAGEFGINIPSNIEIVG